MKFEAQRRFTSEQEDQIRQEYATGTISQGALARRHGCSQGTIARILKAKPEMNVAALQRRIEELEAALATARNDALEEAKRVKPVKTIKKYLDPKIMERENGN